MRHLIIVGLEDGVVAYNLVFTEKAFILDHQITWESCLHLHIISERGVLANVDKMQLIPSSDKLTLKIKVWFMTSHMRMSLIIPF